MPPRKKTVVNNSDSDSDAAPVGKKRARPSTGNRKNRDDDSSSEEEETDYEGEGDGNGKGKGKKGRGAKKGGKKGKGKGKAKKGKGGEGSDSDGSGSGEGSDEEDGGRVKGALSVDERRKLVKAMTRQVLFLELNRKPVRREDLTKTVLTKGKGKYFNELLPIVQRNLRAVLGYELVSLRSKHNSKAAPKSFILRSTLPLSLLASATATPVSSLEVPAQRSLPKLHAIQNELSAFEADLGTVRDYKKEGMGEYGVLGLILGLILVSGKVISDEQLISYLKRFSLTPTTLLPSTSLTSARSTTQTVNSYMSLLTKQNYLEKMKSATAGLVAATQGGGKKGAGGGEGDQSVEWKWGARSEVEFGEMGIAKFMTKIFLSQGRHEEGAADEDGVPLQRNGNGNGVAGGNKGRKNQDKVMTEIARAAGDPLKDVSKAFDP